MMSHRWNSCICLAVLVVGAGSAQADSFDETILIPTGSVLSWPSSSLLSTSYVVPTTYGTTILPTSTVLATDSVIYPTSTTYVSRGYRYRPRRFVERTSYTYSPMASFLPSSTIRPTMYLSPSTLLPTTYLSGSSLIPTTYVSSGYVPTSYLFDTAMIETSTSPCDLAPSVPPVARAATSPSSGGNPIRSEPTNGGGGGSSERRPSATLNNAPPGGDEVPSNVVPPVVSTPPSTGTTPPTAPTRSPAESGGPPPNPPIIERDPNEIQLPPPGRGTVNPGAPSETGFRTVRRPAFDGRNILRGRVISADSRQPEEGVTVIVANRTGNFTDRTALTDADGEFKVSLPEGDWTVKVKMPSGSIFAVGRDFVTASGGRVSDSSGRGITDFLITR